MTPQIIEFCFNNAPWRIDCLGGLRHPGEIHSEPRIDVFMSELAQASMNPLNNGSLVQPYVQKSVTVNAGLISLLKKGSVWINGVRVPPAEQPEVRTFTLHSDQFSFTRFNDLIEIEGIEQQILAPKRYRLSENTKEQAAGAWLAVAFNPAPDVAVIAIPCTALFQMCAATSPKAVRQLLFGDIDKIIDPTCGVMVKESGTYFVQMFKDFRNCEAKTIANLKADDIGQREYARLRDTLQIESINQHPGNSHRAPTSHIKFGLPFTNAATMTVQGKPIKFEFTKAGKFVERWGFLVTDILSLKVRLVFDRLVIDRKNNNAKGENAGDPDLKEGWSGAPSAPVEPIEPFQPIDSDLEPSRDLEALCLDVAGDFEAQDLDIEEREKVVQKYAKRARILSDGSVFSGLGATGESKNNGKASVEVVINKSQTPKVPVTLHDFFKSLDLLEAKSIWFRTIAVSKWFRPRENAVGFVNFWPLSIKGCSSWHLMSMNKPKIPRAYAIAALERAGVWHYLVEVQRKGSAMALLHIRTQDGQAINPLALEKFMIHVALQNGWGARDLYKNWKFSRISHPSHNRVAGLADAIIKVL